MLRRALTLAAVLAVAGAGLAPVGHATTVGKPVLAATRTP